MESYFASVHVCATFLLPELKYFGLQQFQSTRLRERGMRRFKSAIQAQGFLDTHAAVSNLFNLGRHLISANHYRDLREGAFNEWDRAEA